MKTIHYVLIFGTVILALVIFFNWEKVKALFSKEKPAESNAFEECVKKNQSLPDGAECNNCIPADSQQAVFKGIIKDGQCVPIRPDETPAVRNVPAILQIINPNGAAIYIFSGGIFQQTRGGIVPYRKNLRILQIASTTTQGIFYKTSDGWLQRADVMVT